MCTTLSPSIEAQIVNVQTPCKGKRLRDELQIPVSALDNPQVDFLYNLLDWLDEWKNRTAQYDCGKLTKETPAALHRTTHELLNVLYVLFGKIQTDSLEDRFGKYTQLAGSQYHVSIRQICEGENKMRLQSTLPAVSKPSQHESRRDEQWEDLDRDEGAARANYDVVVTQDTLSKMTDIIPVLERLKCEKCRDILTIDEEVAVSVEDPNYDLVKELDRGGLGVPTDRRFHRAVSDSAAKFGNGRSACYGQT
ncbi:hypothetical protein HPB48_002665 [Haemaphysalis longicornis]|uniref:Uncharacterized protein n=1 Tax=Haemaphysalis longicornis TaxID=44386 RepID=A0A9J6GVB1_HAELO|nr:hypothetical protein HPB48_002665 [Haemaphysalis longicornis]